MHDFLRGFLVLYCVWGSFDARAGELGYPPDAWRKSAFELFNRLDDKGRYNWRKSVLNASKAAYQVAPDDGRDSQKLLELINRGLDGYWKTVIPFGVAVGEQENPLPWDAPKNHFGLVARNGDKYLVAFRGTDSSEAVYTDLSCRSQEVHRYYPEHPETAAMRKFWEGEDRACIHRGFMKAALSCQDDVFGILQSLGFGAMSDEIVLTGHSLGGAIATIFAAQVYARYYQEEIAEMGVMRKVPNPVKVVTLGAPRPFNEEAKNLYDARLRNAVWSRGNANVMRLVNVYRPWPVKSEDPVPALPPSESQLGWTYKSPGEEVLLLYPRWCWSSGQLHFLRVYQRNIESHPEQLK